MINEHDEAATLRVLEHLGLPDDRGGPTTHADGMLRLPAGHYWSMGAELVAAVRGDGPDTEAARLQQELDSTGVELEAARGHVTRLREELDKLNTGRQKLQEEHDEYARRTDREVYTSLRECEYLRTTLHRVRAWVDRGEPLSAVRGLVAETHLDMAGPRSSLRAGVEADAWCEYWQREATAARTERDQALNLTKEALTDRAAVLQVLDAALVDPDAPEVEDCDEPDDPGSLLGAAEAVASRLRLAEAEVVRLAGEVERLSAGEVPLIPLVLTGGAQ